MGLRQYLTIASCVAITTPIDAQTLDAVIGGTPHQLEVVDDITSRQKGLMGRTTLGTASGMLFDFPAGTRPTIWMRHMHMALDFLFVDDQARVAQIFPEVPPCKKLPCPVYKAERPLRFVIELAPGSAQALGLEVGEQLDLGGRERMSPPDS